MNSNPQTDKFALTTGALGYRTRSDITATDPRYLVSGSQNVLVNEATDKDGDKVESRSGYTLKGAADTSGDRYKIKSEFVFKTKAGTSVMGRMNSNGVLEFYSETSEAWETLLTTLDGDYPLRWATVWDATELIRRILMVNHSSTLYNWTGAQATLDGANPPTATPNHITVNETIATQGFLASSGTIRVKDTGGTWRTFTVTATAGKVFTVTEDPTAYTFDDDAIAVQGVGSTATTPASGFTNDIIKVLENHVYVGSHTSSIVYMSASDDFTDYTFSSPRTATEGWQFVLDDFLIGFEKNVGDAGVESMVFFAGNDWIYRVKFVDIADTSIAQLAQINPITVSSGQGASSQELITKVKNAIVYLNTYNELMELGQLENLTQPQQTPISDPIKPDFLAADFTDGSLRFLKNNLYATAGASGLVFILAFRETSQGTRRFWQPPQTLPVGQLSDYNGDLIGHSAALTESYTLFDGTNDNGQPIAFKAHFAYNNFDSREKLKNFDKYFIELYLTANTTIMLTLLYEYLAAKSSRSYSFAGTETTYLFEPNLSAALGVNPLGTSPLGTIGTAVSSYLKYRRFKKVVPTDFYEYQARFECDELDAQFQILCHGPNMKISTNAPAKITS